MDRTRTDQTAYYKQHQSHHAPQATPSSQPLQHPRPSTIVQQSQQHVNPSLPQQAPPSQTQHASYSHSSTHGLPSQHQPGFASGPPAASAQQSQDLSYYAQTSPYSNPSVSGSYTSAETPDIMAAAHMSRPYPPIYHTPQSNSPASVASPSGHDQHGRTMYAQQPPQMPQQMYGYPQPYPPMGPTGAPYGHQPSPQQHSLSGPLLMSHPPGQAQLQQQHHQQHQQQQQQQQQQQHQQQHQQHPQHPQHQVHQQQPQQQQQPPPPQQPLQHPQHAISHQQTAQVMMNSPRQKPAQTPLQRPQPGPINQAITTPQHAATAPPAPGNPNSLQASNAAGAAGVNPNAAPGPIPATTPLVVRQDGNGVQWIAFEYSRDRVKMEYTIRCDVESVNVETLSQDFKTENCVYPRACCSKDQYRGNRLNYETECNTVGWALAELNPPLRGKRGLIQRAVDSWRNSNQDPRLRSRRVRRMAKINTRKVTQPPSTAVPAQIPIPTAQPAVGVPTSTAIPPSTMKPSMGVGGQQLHHHHAHPDGSAPGGAEDVSANGEYQRAPSQQQASNGMSSVSSGDVRPRHVFQGYASGYPANPSLVGSAMPPTSYDTLDQLGGHVTSHATAVVPSDSRSDDSSNALGVVPEVRRRKFILVDDPHRGSRVRVRVTLDQVQVDEIPDSYRKSSSVYPRSYFPMQTTSPSRSRGVSNENDDDEAEQSEQVGRGRTMVPVSLLDGAETEVALPRVARGRRQKDDVLNDMAYRMSWSQSRVFAGRTMFLQKALDAFRNKMHSTMTSAGQDVCTTAPHFETRIGKRKWIERTRRARREESP